MSPLDPRKSLEDESLQDIVVSAIVVTYNHEQYLRQALDSVLQQKTTFRYEIVISEDCSTDSTLSIVEEYRARHPDMIRVIASETNLNNNDVVRRAIAAARGRYLAFLDGDDYWVSDGKLQAQFDHMEAHPDCVISFHDVARGNDAGETIRIESGYPARQTFEDLVQGNFIATCTCMTRRTAIENLPAWLKEVRIGDWPIHLWAAQSGFIDHVDGLLSYYRIHAAAAWQTRPLMEQWTYTLSILMQIESNFGARYREAFERSRRNVVDHMIEALARSERLGDDAIARFEAERRADEAEARALAAERRAASAVEQRDEADRQRAEAETRGAEPDGRTVQAEQNVLAARLNVSRLELEKKHAEQRIRDLEQSRRAYEEQSQFFAQILNVAERQLNERMDRVVVEIGRNIDLLERRIQDVEHNSTASDRLIYKLRRTKRRHERLIIGLSVVIAALIVAVVRLGMFAA